MSNTKSFYFLSLSILSFISCTSHQPLPFIGESEVVNGITVNHQVPVFRFADQNGDSITTQTMSDKIYVADFFFTRCPTICPKMARQMLRLHEHYRDNPDFALLSHSIDPKHDSVPVLKKYSEKLGVSASKSWHFLHVPSDVLNFTAMEYLAALQKDTTSDQGFTHTGHFILIDQDRHIRSYCDGTKPDEVNRLMRDIDWLIAEKNKK